MGKIFFAVIFIAMMGISACSQDKIEMPSQGMEIQAIEDKQKEPDGEKSLSYWDKPGEQGQLLNMFGLPSTNTYFFGLPF